MHEAAAELADHSAELGLGDVAQHREQAREHLRRAGADRAEARYDDRLREQFES